MLLLVVAVGAGVPGWWCRSLAEAGLQSADYQSAQRWSHVADWVAVQEPATLLQRARLELAWNRTGAAERWVRQAEQLDRHFPGIESHKRLIEAHRGDRPAVEMLTRSAESSVPPTAVYRAAVRCAMQNGQFAFARQTAEQWNVDFPDDAAATYHRARIAELEAQTEEAEAAYREALRQQPHYAEAAFRLATLHRHQHRFEKAAQLFLQCRDAALQPIAMIEAAEAAWLAGKTERAWHQLEPVLQVPPQELRPLYLRVDEFAENDRAALLAARLKQEQGTSTQVVLFAERAIDYQPRNREAHQLLAAAFQRMERPAKAAEHVAIQAELLEADQNALALQTKLAADPTNVEIRCELAEALFDGVSLADAQVQLEMILEQQPDLARAHALLARLYAERAKRAERTKQRDRWRVRARHHALLGARVLARDAQNEATVVATRARGTKSFLGSE